MVPSQKHAFDLWNPTCQIFCVTFCNAAGRGKAFVYVRPFYYVPYTEYLGLVVAVVEGMPLNANPCQRFSQLFTRDLLCFWSMMFVAHQKNTLIEICSKAENFHDFMRRTWKCEESTELFDWIDNFQRYEQSLAFLNVVYFLQYCD